MKEDTGNNFPFTIEGKKFASEEQTRTANSIIEMAQKEGIPAAQDGVEKLTLKGEAEIYFGDDPVDLAQDSNFTIGVKVYEFKVNGQELESNLAKLVSLDIIKLAQEKGVPLPAKPENLLLEAVGGAKFGPDAWVDLGQFREFLLLSNEPTPVA